MFILLYPEQPEEANGHQQTYGAAGRVKLL
jgi:hypothetical protein